MRPTLRIFQNNRYFMLFESGLLLRLTHLFSNYKGHEILVFPSKSLRNHEIFFLSFEEHLLGEKNS